MPTEQIKKDRLILNKGLIKGLAYECGVLSCMIVPWAMGYLRGSSELHIEPLARFVRLWIWFMCFCGVNIFSYHGLRALQLISGRPKKDS